MSLKLSKIARSILEFGLADDPTKELFLPSGIIPLAGEIYNVPEQPKDFKQAYICAGFPKVILASGGLDSTVSWLMAKEETGKDPQAFYVNMGQPYAQKELARLEQMGIPVEVITVPVPEHIGDGKWKHIHPGRNLYYITLVAERLKEPADLVLSAVDGEISEHGGDKSKVFFEMVNMVLAMREPEMRLVTPLSNMTKTDLVAWAIDHGHLETVKQTISCFDGTTGRCGKCQSCLRTWMAFYYNGVELDFEVHPMEGAREYVEKYKRVLTEALEKGDFSHYSSRRCHQDLGAMKKWEEKVI